jgi:Beta-lactamase enzyme family
MPGPTPRSTAVAASAPRAPASPAAAHPWRRRILDARRWGSRRAGVVGFAVVDERGVQLGGFQPHRTFRSASVVKAMFMVCYLQRPDVRRRALQSWERRLLDPMIRRSDDAAANRMWGLVSQRCLHRLARRAGMRNFSTQGVWGLTRITPAGTARLFWSIDRWTPVRHRRYARTLLRTIVPSQRWGIAKAVPPGFTIYFKGGFVGPPGGRVENQGALLRAGSRRLALAVLTNDNPSHRYGATTQREVARRLLRGYPPADGPR